MARAATVVRIRRKRARRRPDVTGRRPRRAHARRGQIIHRVFTAGGAKDLMRGVIAIVTSIPIALAAAGVMWLWWRSPVPTYLVFTPLLHGMLLGVALAWLVGRLG